MTTPEVDVTTEPAARCLVAMMDIRGFSAFAHGQNDPVAVAGYVAAATRHILSTVRDSTQLASAVIKPLGDGMLFILKLEDAPQTTMAHTTMLMLNELVDVSEKFAAYLLLNRPAAISVSPSRLGIGVSFGPLVRLTAKSAHPEVQLEDYVGHTINLAARLQHLARNGGCVVDETVFEKLLKHDSKNSSFFHSLFPKREEVRVPNVGALDETVVYTNTDIPPEYLKSKLDEKRLEEFASKSLSELRATYIAKRTTDSHRLRLPETTRFILFKRDGDRYLETVPYMVGQKLTFKNEVSFKANPMKVGVCPVTDAIVTRKTVVVSYLVPYDECDENDNANPYWQQTLARFPEARIEVLRSLAMHPASILAVPLIQPDGVAAVAVFDTSETAVFNDGIASEMEIKLRLIYEQLFGLREQAQRAVIEM